MTNVFEKLKSKINYIKELKQGGIITDYIREERLQICLTCDKLNRTLNTCSECGCFVVSKTYLAHASCPINKWSMVELPKK